MGILDEVKQRILDGATYDELSLVYPLTKNGFKLLGGVSKRKRVVSDHSIACVYGKKIDPLKGSLEILVDDERSCALNKTISPTFLLGTLLGDASLVLSTESGSVSTYYYMLAHTWRQISYMKLNYESLKSYVSALRMSEPKEGMGYQDYTIYLTTKSSNDFYDFYKLFYTEFNGENNLRKDVLKKEIADKIDYESLAYWIMDDGSSRGYGKGVFRISIGIQNHYTRERANLFVSALSEKLGFPIYFSIDKYSITLNNKIESSDKVIRSVAPYIIPDMAYKLGLTPNECGAVYKGLCWFKKWEEEKLHIEHPFMEIHTYREYQESTDEVFRERYKKSLLYRTQVRGFPFPDYTNQELLGLWEKLCKSSVDLIPTNLRPNHNLNRFPSYFMKNRYYGNKKGKKSPYSVFLDKDALGKVIDLQLKSGDGLNNSNIRNAIGSYGTSVLAQFNPAYARYLINSFSKEGDAILDPCSGWGSRLSSAISMGRSYYGIEPCKETYSGLTSIKNWFDENNIPSNITLINGCAEDLDSYGTGMFDMAITSPPFFNKEDYSDEDSQSDKRYANFVAWCDGFLRNMIRNVYSSLKNGGIFILNVMDYSDCPLAYVTKLLCTLEGFSLKDTYYTEQNKRPLAGLSNREEFIIMEKKDGR